MVSICRRSYIANNIFSIILKPTYVLNILWKEGRLDFDIIYRGS